MAEFSVIVIMSYAAHLLSLALFCAVSYASQDYHKSNTSPYGHPLTDREALLNETRRVHPYFNPRDRERPLITTCCDLSANDGHPSHTVPPQGVKDKCLDIVSEMFLTEEPQSSSEEEFGIDVMDRNMTICLLECYYGEMNLTTDEGNIIFDQAVSVILTDEKEELGLTERMVERCVVRANIIGMAMSQHKGYACNFAPVEFEQCILERVDLLCPEDYQITAELCEKYRNKLKRKYSVE